MAMPPWYTTLASLRSRTDGPESAWYSVYASALGVFLPVTEGWVVSPQYAVGLTTQSLDVAIEFTTTNVRGVAETCLAIFVEIKPPAA